MEIGIAGAGGRRKPVRRLQESVLKREGTPGVPDGSCRKAEGKGEERAKRGRFPLEKVRPRKAKRWKSLLLKHFSPAVPLQLRISHRCPFPKKQKLGDGKRKYTCYVRSLMRRGEKIVLKITRTIVMMMMVVMIM